VSGALPPSTRGPSPRTSSSLAFEDTPATRSNRTFWDAVRCPLACATPNRCAHLRCASRRSSVGTPRSGRNSRSDDRTGDILEFETALA